MTASLACSGKSPRTRTAYSDEAVPQTRARSAKARFDRACGYARNDGYLLHGEVVKFGEEKSVALLVGKRRCGAHQGRAELGALTFGFRCSRIRPSVVSRRRDT